MANRLAPSWSLERRFVAAAATVAATVVWSHGLAALFRHLGPADAPLASWGLTLGALFAALAGAAAWPSRLAPTVAGGTSALAAAIVAHLLPGSGAAAGALLLVAPLATWGGERLGRRLPESIDGALRRRRRAAPLWAAVALLAVGQIGHLATWMTDPQSTRFLLATDHPFWAGHECLPAYLYGDELAARGESNLYDGAHYPGLNPDAAPSTEMFGMRPEDPYQYPPQFLLLPRLARTLTHDYGTVRVVWFALQVTLLAGVYLWLALWSGGRAGRLAAWLLPLALSAFPMLYALQYGQFHVAAVALSVAALLAIETRRRALGGALLAIAISAKLFPALLLLPLAVRRRWRELGWTAAFGALLALLGLAVLGTAPYAAFFASHLPRLADGTAFAFDAAWPELRELVLADNQGFAGLLAKLSALGVPGLEGTARRIATLLYLASLAAAALHFGRREAALARPERAAGWLGLVGLGSLASSGAWGDYVPLTAIWLLALLADRLRDGARVAVPLAACWLFQYTLLGTTPIGSWAPMALLVPLSAVASLSLFALFGWATVARASAATASASAGKPAGVGLSAVAVRAGHDARARRSVQ